MHASGEVEVSFYVMSVCLFNLTVRNELYTKFLAKCGVRIRNLWVSKFVMDSKSSTKQDLRLVFDGFMQCDDQKHFDLITKSVYT